MLVTEEVKVESAKGAAYLIHQLIYECLIPPDFPILRPRSKLKQKKQYEKNYRRACKIRDKNIHFVESNSPILEYFCDAFNIDQEKLCKKILERNQYSVFENKRPQ